MAWRNEVRKAWQRYRSLPTWGQALLALVLAFLLIGLIPGGGGSGNEVTADQAEDQPTTSATRRATTSTALATPTTEPVTTTTVRTPPRLGDPADNAGKMNYKTVKFGCVSYQIAPVMREGDPVDQILLESTCGAPLPMAEARAALPADGGRSCINTNTTSVRGPFVEVRLWDEFYPCQEGEEDTGVRS